MEADPLFRLSRIFPWQLHEQDTDLTDVLDQLDWITGLGFPAEGDRRGIPIPEVFEVEDDSLAESDKTNTHFMLFIRLASKSLIQSTSRR